MLIVAGVWLGWLRTYKWVYLLAINNLACNYFDVGQRKCPLPYLE